MNILICDDEVRYIEDIEINVKNYFNEKGQKVCFECFTDGEKALNDNLGQYDIAFLDIEIGEVKGTKIAEMIKAKNSHTVIFFITAYNNYLDEAMDLNAFRFLSKPLDIKRLFAGLEKALELIDNTVISFMIKDSSTVYKISASDIIYVEILGRYTKVVTTDGEYMSNNSMSYWQEKLTATYFYLVHKSFIVNTNYITKYNSDQIVLNNKFDIPIAYRKRAPFRKYFLRKIEDR